MCLELKGQSSPRGGPHVPVSNEGGSLQASPLATRAPLADILVRPEARRMSCTRERWPVQRAPHYARIISLGALSVATPARRHVMSAAAATPTPAPPPAPASVPSR